MWINWILGTKCDISTIPRESNPINPKYFHPKITRAENHPSNARLQSRKQNESARRESGLSNIRVRHAIPLIYHETPTVRSILNFNQNPTSKTRQNAPFIHYNSMIVLSKQPPHHRPYCILLFSSTIYLFIYLLFS